MPGWIGLPELLILLVVVLIFFGPKRLPEMGRSLGRGMREFKDSVTGTEKDEDEHVTPLPTGSFSHEMAVPPAGEEPVVVVPDREDDDLSSRKSV